MTEQFDRIRNFNVSVKELDEDVLFLRKLEAGGSAHSFGIHVAKMAGMPQYVLSRSRQMLQQLESSRGENKTDSGDAMQLQFFQMDDPLLTELRAQVLDLDIDQLTPIEALMQLHALKRKLESEKDL
jgi:DNA mismatch repair protein MutS